MSMWNTENLMGITGAPSEYIGKRFVYSRRESEIRYDWLIPVLTELGLEGYAPTQPSPADAFRRGCSEIDRGYIKEGNIKYKISMIRIDESDNPIIRNIQLTEVDKQNKSTSDGNLVAKIKYDRSTEVFSVQYGYNAGFHLECPDFVVERIEFAQEKYLAERYLVSDQAVATMIRRILEGCGITVKNIPSTWTIPASREHTLNALVALAERMNSEIAEDIFNVDILPVISTKETKKKLSIDAVAYAFDRLSRILKQEQDAVVKATDIEKQKETSQQRFNAEAEKVLTIVQEYETLLGEALDEVAQMKVITENKLKAFCESDTARATYKAKTESDKPKRKIRAVNEAPLFIDNDDTPPLKPVRRFNMDVQQAAMF